MDNPRPEKVAVVEEVRQRLDSSTASVVTEYRGLTVAQLAELRQSLRAVGGDYKIFKNTLVRRAVDGSPHAPIEELLTGPTGITFVQGDVSAVAKTLRDFSRAHAQLVVKGGILDGAALSPAQLVSLAELPSREVLLARVAGAIAAPMTQLASLIEALPRNLAYGLKALLELKGGAPDAGAAGEPASAGADAETAETEGIAESPETAEPEATAETVETAESPETAEPEATAETAESPETAEPEATAETAETAEPEATAETAETAEPEATAETAEPEATAEPTTVEPSAEAAPEPSAEADHPAE